MSEAIANDTAILYTSRGRFVEYDMLVQEMPRYLRAQFIDQADLLTGNWAPALETATGPAAAAGEASRWTAPRSPLDAILGHLRVRW